METRPQRSAFTEHVRRLAGGTPPSDRELVRLWQALRNALRAELRRRHLWESPPSYLGIFGWPSWSDGSEGEGETADEAGPQGYRKGALDELVAECYSFIFVDRARSLEAHGRLKANVDGLVFLNIRHFFYERQRAHDPLGFHVFEVLQSSVRRSIEASELYVLAGDPRVRNDTVVGFQRGSPTLPPALPDLRPLLAHWIDELLPDLVTAQGRGQEAVAERLRRLLPELRGAGIEALRFKDLLDPLKHDVRVRWAALLTQGEGEMVRERSAGDSQSLLPDTAVEERQSFRDLERGVAESIGSLKGDPRTRRYLAALWDHLRSQAVDAADPRPSDRQLAGLLGIPRERLPKLFRELGRMIEGHRAATVGRTGRSAETPLHDRARERHER